MPGWVVAGDIGRRLAERRERLGEGQRDFAARFGRTWKRVSAWENGAAAPPQSALEHAATRYGWPREMFAEDGPYPKQALESSIRHGETRSNGEAGSVPRTPGRRQEDVELRAAAIRKDAARLDVIARLIRAYRDAGKAPGVGTLDEWLDILAASRGRPSPPAGSSPPGEPP